MVLALQSEGRSPSEIARRTGIPRSTVREWLVRPVRCDDDRCARCGRRHETGALSASYVYLLGLYLGDGYISEHRPGVYRLRVFLDRAHPGIVASCSAAMQELVPENRVGIHHAKSNYTELRAPTTVRVSAYSKAWPCLFPQHGPGKKHERPIVLATWQRTLVACHPEAMLRGLVHSDGCRFVNTGRNWRCPRYSFSNLSDDIRAIFCDACDLLGVHWTTAPATVYVSRKADVARLDEFIGPKA